MFSLQIIRTSFPRQYHNHYYHTKADNSQNTSDQEMSSDNSSGEMNMSDSEENNKPDVDSPALSVPSLAAASYSSSPESSPDDKSKSLPTRRALFKMSNEDTSPKYASSVLIDGSSLNGNSVIDGEVPIDEENSITDAASITSSEITAVPSWNLSTKDATESNVEIPLNYYMASKPSSLLSSSSSLASDRNHHLRERRTDSVLDETKPVYFENVVDKENNPLQANQMKQPPLIMEEPPEETISCNSALNLTPVQLAEIFVSFGQTARQRYQDFGQKETSSETHTPIKAVGCASGEPIKESPPPIMTSSHLSESSSESDKSQDSFSGEIPRIQSLERECDALKKSIQQDASTILNLHWAVNAQKQLNSLKEVEIMDKQTDLQIMEEQIERLKKERDDQIEKETDFVETISILKEELDRMTSNSGPSFDKIENERFEMELKSAASRIDEQHSRIKELESVLEEKGTTAFGLQTKNDRLNHCQYRIEPVDEQDRQPGDVEDVSDDHEDTILNPFSTTALSWEVRSTLKNILERLEAMENEESEKVCVFTEQLNKNNEEMEKVRRVLQLEPQRKCVRVNISEDPEAIEVMSFEDKSLINADSENRTNWCCDINLLG